ncbi:MAG: lipopolysaccharide biosynthesis protein [Clostridiaceae bacterium]|nr:lipopolysaccharide biosynthesis protein [Clostridiaceae bacterium]
MEEIGIREMLELVQNKKRFIIVFTSIFVIISIIISFFVLEPVYESHTMLMISPINNVSSQNESNNNFVGLVETLSQYPEMTVETYREQVKAPAILDYIRTEMVFQGQTLRSIGDKIEVNAIKDTNIITIKVKDSHPEKAAKMANLVSVKFTEFISDTNKKRVESSAQFIMEQIEKEKANLDNASATLKDFLSQPRGPNELKLELESKLNQLTEFKTRVTQVRVDEETTRASLEQGKSLLSNTPKTLVTNKTIISDSLLSDIVKDKTNLSTTDLSRLKLSDEQINQVYIALENSVNDLNIKLSSLAAERKNIETEITARQKEIEQLQTDLADKQQKFDILNHELELIRQTYDAYQQNYKEAMIKQSAELGKSSIVVLSEAIPALNPVSPNKLLNIIVSMIFGIVVSCAYVIFKEYYLSEPKKNISL